MIVTHTSKEISDIVSSFIGQEKSIGFVPTMGALHLGHLSLLERALNENDEVVLSIFVNPTQFNNAEDLEKYPRTFERDIDIVKQLSDRIVVFAPSVEDIYGHEPIATVFDYEGLESEMEGANRPGHFDGVGTIVKKLFEIVRPMRAYFGEKDFQQLQIIKKMVEKENFAIAIIGCPIYRELSGLAMSSRNERLTVEGKQKAAFIYNILQKTRDLFQNVSIDECVDFVKKSFEDHSDFELEYFVIADENNLKTAVDKKENEKYRGFLVAHLEGVRLIDNVPMYEEVLMESLN